MTLADDVLSNLVVRPAGTHQSYPVPVPGLKGMNLAFLYGKAMVVKSGEGYQLWPPSHLAMPPPGTRRSEGAGGLSGLLGG